MFSSFSHADPNHRWSGSRGCPGPAAGTAPRSDRAVLPSRDAARTLAAGFPVEQGLPGPHLTGHRRSSPAEGREPNRGTSVLRPAQTPTLGDPMPVDPAGTGGMRGRALGRWGSDGGRGGRRRGRPGEPARRTGRTYGPRRTGRDREVVLPTGAEALAGRTIDLTPPGRSRPGSLNRPATVPGTRSTTRPRRPRDRRRAGRGRFRHRAGSDRPDGGPHRSGAHPCRRPEPRRPAT